MNKRIFTLLTAGLLLGGPAFNAAYAAVGDKTVVSYTTTETALGNGMTFYLGASNTTLYAKYTSSDILKLKGDKEVVSLTATTASATNETAAEFTIRNYSSRTFELWVTIDGKEYQVITKGDGTAVTGDQSTKNLSDFNTKFIVKDGKLKFKGLFTAALPASEVGSNLQAFSYAKEIGDEYLTEYNSKGTTLSFDYTTSELVGNLFDSVTPVTVSADITAADAKIQTGTYFVKGDAKKVEAFVAEVEDGTNNEAAISAAKEISFLAVDPTQRYNINGKQDGEGYALYWMKGEVAAKDSSANASFTISLKDAFNEDGKLILTMKPSVKEGNTWKSYDVNVAAVKPSVSDTKTYVTTVLSGSTKTNYTPIHPQLGANSYLDASVLLKKNAENVVNIYFTSNDEDKSSEGKPNAQTEYHKYLTVDPATGDGLRVVAYNSADFTMPVSQWIVSGFDGKYNFTLTNRETGEDLVLRLQPDGKEGGYKVDKATYDGEEVTIKGDEKASKGVTEDLALNTTSVKFNTIATTRTDGYKVFTDTQIAEGFKMTFNGKNVFGDKTLYAVLSNDKKSMKVSTDEKATMLTLYPERVKGAETLDKSLQGVADYILNTNTYAYLNDKNEVVRVADKDTLVVPTYILRTTEVKGDDARYLGAAAATDKEKDAATEFAIIKNAAGGYSLVSLAATSGGTLDYAASIDNTSAFKTASVNSTNLTVAYDKKRYVAASDLNDGYANVEILDANPFNPSLASQPRHASFDNMLGSINYQLNKNGITEGILSAESMIFWLDTADSKAKTPSFYISKGIEVAEGEEAPAERMFMFNAQDSLKYFVEGSAQEYTNEAYYLEGTEDTKVIFRPAILEGVDTIATTVNGEAVKVVKELESDGETVNSDRLDAFKFNITLAKDSEDEYVISSQRKIDGKTVYVYALNGKLGLTADNDIAMVFTLGTDVPTSNGSVEDAASSIVVVGGNGVVTIQGAAGQNAYVRTVLGQSVAETVLTSDNATIAVPAGIVFVTVGEETVKVVVK